MKCFIDKQLVLSRMPEGPLAAHIGPFAEALDLLFGIASSAPALTPQL